MKNNSVCVFWHWKNYANANANVGIFTKGYSVVVTVQKLHRRACPWLGKERVVAPVGENNVNKTSMMSWTGTP